MERKQPSEADYKAAIKSITAIHAAKPRSGHRIWKDLVEGNLSRPQVVEFLKQSGCIPLYNHHFHGHLYINCPNAEWRSRMAEVVYEEGTGRIYSDGVAHFELYLRMGEAFGISREEMYGTKLCAGALGVRHFYENICRRSFLEGFAALSLGGEASGPGVIGKVSDAFIKHYGLTAEQARFYSVHEEADSDHSSGGMEFLHEFAKNQSELDLAIKSVEDAVDVMWGMWEEILHRVQKIK
ncbi:MAG: hypothetical protein EXR27_01985 [Betaproteobacteria bacterium]|nr:hypothetical protein [Betaproteobacteria bacterium]